MFLCHARGDGSSGHFLQNLLKMPLYSNEPAQTEPRDTMQWDQISQNMVAHCDIAAYLCSAKVIQCLIFHIPEIVHVQAAMTLKEKGNGSTPAYAYRDLN